MAQADQQFGNKDATDFSASGNKLPSFHWSEYPAALCPLALGTFNFGVMVKDAACIGVPVSLGNLLMQLLPPICGALLLGYLIKLLLLIGEFIQVKQVPRFTQLLTFCIHSRRRFSSK
jgi:hypothetical protein